VKRAQKESGQALVAAAFALIVLLGAAGLAIDLGYLRFQRRLQQSAADSAAIAGAAEAPAGNAIAAATQDAKLNGFNNGVNNVTVSVNPAFPFGAVTGVQVQVSALHPTFFMRVFGVTSSTVSATAVAINNSAKNCVYALNIFGTGITNSGTLTANIPAPGCGIVANSSLLNTGSINAASVSVHGSAFGSLTIPAAITGIVQAADPLFRLNAPGTGGACKSGPNPGDDGIIVGATGTNPTTSFTLSPGKYCSGIKITNRANLTLNPGTYVITGTSAVNGINWNGSGTVTGAGVTFYVAPAAGQVAINNLPAGSETLSLTAITTGPRAGILFYQSPGNTLTATIKGIGASVFQGTFYFPRAHLNLSDTGTTAAYTLAVARSLTLSGTVKFASDFSSLPGGSPIKQAVLAE
jgi:hypothetical protein